MWNVDADGADTDYAAYGDKWFIIWLALVDNNDSHHYNNSHNHRDNNDDDNDDEYRDNDVGLMITIPLTR